MDGGRRNLSDSCGKLIQKSASVYRNAHAAGRVHNKHRVPEDKINDYFAAIERNVSVNIKRRYYNQVIKEADESASFCFSVKGRMAWSFSLLAE